MSEPESHDRPGLAGAVAKSLIVLPVLALALFLSSGRWVWTEAWVYIGIVTVSSVLMLAIMDRELILERASPPSGFEKWDAVPALIVGRVGPLATIVVAGLDQRLAWSAASSLWLRILGLAAVACSLILSDSAILSNHYFSAVIRIQQDRGHAVAAGGPYRFVRHPGYLGALVHILAVPLAFGSTWAFLPAGVTAVVTWVRTALEDRALRSKLEGYPEYARRVRYRLFPGIW